MKEVIRNNSKSAVEQFFELKYHKIKDITGSGLWSLYNEFCGTGEKVPRYIAGMKTNFDLMRLKFVEVPEKPFHSKVHKKTGRWINMRPEVLKEFEEKYSYAKDEEEIEQKEKELKEKVNNVFKINDPKEELYN